MNQIQLKNILLQLEILSIKIDKLSEVIIKGSFEKQENSSIYAEFLHLKITQNEISELMKIGHNKNLIDLVIMSIFSYKNNIKYGSLNIAINYWLKVDPLRPIGENEVLLEHGFPPVQEQLRINPSCTPVTLDTISNREHKNEEIEWRKEAFLNPQLSINKREDIKSTIEALSKKRKVESQKTVSDEMKEFRKWKKENNL
jgi:hypothetical protein